MRHSLDSRLRKREPEPGLLNVGLPLPSVPILNPVITPLIAGASPAPAPPKPAPTTGAQPPSSPPAASSSSGGGNNGGNTPSSGGNPNNGGDHGSTSSSGGSSSSGGTSSPASGGSSGNNGGDHTSNSGGSSPQGDAGQNSPPGTPPSTSGSNASGSSPNADGPPSVGGSMASSSGPTGVTPQPVDNVAVNPSSDTSPSDHAGSASSQSASATNPSNVVGTPPGAQAMSGGSHSTVGGSTGSGGNHGSNGNSGSTTTGDANVNSAASAPHKHIAAGAIGGIVAAIAVACLALAFVIIRNRYKRRKDEQRVEWINGYVSDGKSPDMLQRSNSLRSSWGTPIEYRFSNRRSRAESPTDFQEGVFDLPPSPYLYGRSETGAPVLPMPVHSPTQERASSPEDPFRDVLPQPLQRMASLPLRISLLSSNSGHNPFDDAHEYKADDHESVPDSAISSSTFGHGTGAGTGSRPGALFPMPPPTAGSSTTVFPGNQTLQAPGILISFPDSPISPTFAAGGTSSYPRRASVKQRFLPSLERSDEVHVNQGDNVSVISVYEDGWAFVQSEKNAERGLVPLTCLELNNP